MKFCGGKTTTFSSMKWLLARLIFIKKKNKILRVVPDSPRVILPCSFPYVSVLTTKYKHSKRRSLSWANLLSLCVFVWRIRVAEPTMLVSEYFSNLGNDYAQVVPLTVFVAVLCLCLIIGHLLEENRWVNESITAILTVISVSLSSLSFSVYVFVSMHV